MSTVAVADEVAAAPSWRVEIVAGLTTFLTMAYIVVVNPSILATPGTGMDFDGVLTATVLLCFAMTLLMGLFARLPFAVAPGMGINAFFTYSVILRDHVAWPTALGMVFWSGVIFLVVSVTPIRVRIAQAIPRSLRSAAAVGIGVFLTFIGLKSAGIVNADPVTFVRPGALGIEAGLFVVGCFVAVVMLRKKSPFAFLAAMALATAGGLVLGRVPFPTHYLSTPSFGAVLGKLDIMGALRPALVPAIVSLMFTDLFDSISTFVGVSQAAGLVDERGEPKNLSRGLIVDAVATLGAGLLGTSSGTAFIESAAGIEVGGRTGRTAIVTALCFIPCLFIAPIAAMVPGFATAPVLVIVGALMWRSVRDLELSRLEDAVPAFLTVVLIPLTFSITQGLLWGFVSHVGLYVAVGRGREVSGWLYGIAVLSVGLLLLPRLAG